VLSFGAALCAAAVASAAPFRPALTNVPFTQISDAAAKAAQQSPVCPNGRVCYTPSFIKQAYDVPTDKKAPTGAGQTILIVEAYGSPFIQSDLAQFDAENGLPDPPSLTIVNQQTPTAGGNPNPNLMLWAVETSLDVEYAHAMAPGANIVLDVASTSSGNAINDAEKAAIAAFPRSIFSQSFGIPEGFINAGANNAQLLQANKNYAAGVAKGDTFFASAGDTGATFGTSTAQSNFPASNPNNTNVTGTNGMPYIATGTLFPCPTSIPFSCTWGLASGHGPCVIGRTVPPNCVPDGYGGDAAITGDEPTYTCPCGEQVWNEPSFGAATGGAPSLLFGVPSYQSGLGLTARGPDVDYNAAIDGGVLVVFSGLGSPALFIVGGTSAGAPQWAAIAALANQARTNLSKGPIGAINPTLYAIYHSARYATDFHDITVGNNQVTGTPIGYSAGTGYDLPSGIGTPIVDQLIVDLAAS